MQSSLPISGPLSLGDLLDRAFRLYRANFRPLVLISALFYLPYFIITGLLTGQVLGGYFSMLAAIDSAASSPDEFGSLFGPYFSLLGTLLVLVLPLGVVVGGFVTLALTAQHLAFLRNESISVRASIRAARQRFWAWLGMGVTRALAIAVASLGGLVLLFCGATAIFAVGGFGLAGLFSAAGNVAPWVQGIAIAGTLILIVILYLVVFAIVLLPGTYFLARWVVAVPGLLDQRWGAIESLRQSWQLTRGRFWRAFGYLLLLYVLSIVVISLPQGIIQQILALVFLDNFVISVGLSTVVGSLFTVLWPPLLTAAIVLLYFDLRVRGESYDLDLRVQQLEQEVGVQSEHTTVPATTVFDATIADPLNADPPVADERPDAYA